jgi:hypothetical protein
MLSGEGIRVESTFQRSVFIALERQGGGNEQEKTPPTLFPILPNLKMEVSDRAHEENVRFPIFPLPHGIPLTPSIRGFAPVKVTRD